MVWSELLSMGAAVRPAVARMLGRHYLQAIPVNADTGQQLHMPPRTRHVTKNSAAGGRTCSQALVDVFGELTPRRIDLTAVPRKTNTMCSLRVSSLHARNSMESS